MGCVEVVGRWVGEWVGGWVGDWEPGNKWEDKGNKWRRNEQEQDEQEELH